MTFGAYSGLAAILTAGVVSTSTALSTSSESGGVILSKTFKPAITYTQSHAGPNRGFQGSTDIPIAEAYTFDVRIDGLSQVGRIALNTIAAKQFEVGQRVKVRYEYRKVFLFTRKLFILDMQPS